MASVVSMRGAPRMAPTPISFPASFPTSTAISGRTVSGRAVPIAARTLPTTPSDSPKRSPTHSMPFVNSRAPPRITAKLTTSPSQSTGGNPIDGPVKA